jgi:hypothetical protein
MLKVTFNMISLQYWIYLYKICHTNEQQKFSDKSTVSTSRQDEEEATDSLEPEGKVLDCYFYILKNASSFSRTTR